MALPPGHGAPLGVAVASFGGSSSGEDEGAGGGGTGAGAALLDDAAMEEVWGHELEDMDSEEEAELYDDAGAGGVQGLSYEALATQKRRQRSSQAPRVDAFDADPGGTALAAAGAAGGGAKRRGRRRMVSTGARLPRHLPERVMNSMGQANLYISENKFDEAEKVLEDVIREFPTLPEAYEQLSMVAELTDNLDRALDLQHICIQILNPRSMHAHGYNQVLGGVDARAQMNAEVGDATKLGVAPAALNSYKRFANLAVKLGKDTEALKALEKICKLDPTDDDARWDQAAILLDIGKVNRGLKLLEEIRTRRPTDVILLKQVARLNHQLGKSDDAASAVQAGVQAIAEAGDWLDLTLINILTELRMEQGNFSDALAIVSATDAACALVPTGPDPNTGMWRMAGEAAARLCQGWASKAAVQRSAQEAYAKEGETPMALPLDLQVKAGVCCVYLDTGGPRAERCLQGLISTADALIARIDETLGKSGAAGDPEVMAAQREALYVEFDGIKDLLADASDAYVAINNVAAAHMWANRLCRHVPPSDEDMARVHALLPPDSVRHSANLLAKGATNLLRCGAAGEAAQAQCTAINLTLGRRNAVHELRTVIEGLALSLAEQAAGARFGALEESEQADADLAVNVARELLTLACIAGEGQELTDDVTTASKAVAAQAVGLAERYNAMCSAWCDPYAGEEAIAVWKPQYAGVVRRASVMLQIGDLQQFVDTTMPIICEGIPGASARLNMPGDASASVSTAVQQSTRYGRRQIGGPQKALAGIFHDPRQAGMVVGFVRALAALGMLDNAKRLLSHINDMWSGKWRVVAKAEPECRFELRLCEHDLGMLDKDYGRAWYAALQATRVCTQRVEGWNALAHTLPLVPDSVARPGASAGQHPTHSYIHLARVNEGGLSAGAHLVKGHFELLRPSEYAYAVAVRRYLLANRAAPWEPLPLLCASQASAALCALVPDPKRKRRWAIAALALIDKYKELRLRDDEPSDAQARGMLEVEVDYNRGRILQATGFLSAAAAAYERALRSPGIAYAASMGLRRDAAHNLSRIYASSGMVAKAREVVQAHLRFG